MFPEQIAVLDKILKMHDQGVNTSKIVRVLNENGDNLTLSLNKKDKVQIFYPETIKNILKHYRPVNADKPVVPIKNRIVSHHKETSSEALSQNSESNIVRFDGNGPILDIIS